MKIIAWGCRLLLAAVLAWGAAGDATAQEKKYFKDNEPLPPLELRVPREAGDRNYLGVGGQESWFKLSRIKRPLVLIEVFNMYCGICQREAPVVNRLHELLQKDPLGGKLAMIGIGIGNSEYEVGLFRRKFKLGFPTFSDGDYRLHTLLRKPDTPFFILARLEKDDSARVLFTRLGPMGEPEEFLELLKQKAK